MTANPDPASPSKPAHPYRDCALLALALVWVALARTPLVLNARAHLDSDLAVDGLTLIDALDGHWRWHYPATPFIGSPPVLLSWVQARVWGPTPMALVSGGVVAYGLVVAGAYVLNRRAFGPSVAAWGLVPLVFASTGTIWLSGRVTGGHLLTAAWHAWAFAMLWDALTKGGWRRSAMLGLWCGFGLYVDSMFAVTWVGMGVAACVIALKFASPLPLGEGPGVRDAARRVGLKAEDLAAAGGATTLAPGPSPKGRGEANRVGRVLTCLLAFALASGVGVIPRLVGMRVDPHDAYVGQFTPDTRPDHLASNARILLLDCLPRLIAGYRLPGFQAEPDPAKLEGSPTAKIDARRSTRGELALSVISLGTFAWAMVALVIGRSTLDPAQLAIRLGLLASSLAVLAGFLIHPSITGSDNYRYLVFLLVPWSSGYGLAMARMAARRWFGPWQAGVLAILFVYIMTVDSAVWYMRLGWLDTAIQPVRRPVEEPTIAWLDDHPEVSTILGDYWDVYRLSFLTRGRVKAVPFPQYPDRFPEIGRGLSGASHPVVIVRPGPFGPLYRGRAIQAGGRELLRVRGLSIVEWPGGLTP